MPSGTQFFTKVLEKLKLHVSKNKLNIRILKAIKNPK